MLNKDRENDTSFCTICLRETIMRCYLFILIISIIFIIIIITIII